MSEINTITLSDIRNIPDLNKNMVLPGDTYTIGEDGSWNITRVESKSSDKDIDIGVEVTQTQLNNQPELVDRFGLEAGDRWVESENRFIKTGTGSSVKQFLYGFDETPGMIQNIGDILESIAPL